MPLRDYKCAECGHRQEALIRNSRDEEELSCEACGSRELARQISLPAPSGGGCDTGFG